MPREWKPELHPRGHGGKFASKGGGGKGSAAAVLATADKARKKTADSTAKPKPEAKPKPKAGAPKFRKFSGMLEPIPQPKELALSKSELSALRKYTGNEYVSMNEYLTNNRRIRGPARKDHDYVKHVSSNVEALERLTKRTWLTRPTVVTRAIPEHTAERVFGQVGEKVNHTYIDKRFVSTTKDAVPPHTFGPVKIRYRLQPGVRALDVNAADGRDAGGGLDEREFILAPGQRFRVVRDRIGPDGRRAIELESA
jgi:ADP-ribosyltransferase exoenzyme